MNMACALIDTPAFPLLVLTLLQRMSMSLQPQSSPTPCQPKINSSLIHNVHVYYAVTAGIAITLTEIW
jgi:hypothetical protein